MDRLDQGLSVLVAAPTGTGKTLIADYLVETLYRSGRRVIYTAPIKALSNQKFKEFHALLGEGEAGIITGDVVLQPEAPVLVMTTEIFRNLLHQSPDRVQDVAYVIFDEIHWLSDPQRGSVWEESLIFMPSTMRFLGLSATIPNVDELAAWLESVHRQPIAVITHKERAVPLEHRLYEVNRGFCTYEQVKRAAQRLEENVARAGLRRYEGRRQAEWVRPTTHLDLLQAMGREYLPSLFFTFSRRKCESNAMELAEVADYLSPDQKRQVDKVISETLASHGMDPNQTPTLGKLRPLLLKGIAYHHAGLLPVVKDIVESLFDQRLTYVLYCTETFAVGLNFPCRTVCFDGLTKWDGQTFRPLTQAEYFQMAGRAGRRGIDERGFVFTVVDLNRFDPREIPEYQEEKVEPLISRFALSYNSVLQLIKNFDEQQIEEILHKNFAAFQQRQEQERLRSYLARTRQEQASGRPQTPAACPASGTDACPLVYHALEQEVATLQATLRRLQGGSRRGRGRGRRSADGVDVAQVREQLRLLRARLEEATPRDCSEAERRRCRRQLRQQRQRLAATRQMETRLAQLTTEDRFWQEFEDRRLLLAAMDYIREGKLTARGEFAAQIHTQELLVTELFFAGWFHRLPPEQLAALCIAIDYEPRRGDPRVPQRCLNLAEITPVVQWIERMEREFLGTTSVRFQDDLAQLAYDWTQGKPFTDLLKGVAIDPGDVVFAFRRAIDLLRQVRAACQEEEYVAARISATIHRLDRDEVAVVL